MEWGLQFSPHNRGWTFPIGHLRHFPFRMNALALLWRARHLVEE